MKKYLTDYRHFLHGGDYNPEQWLDCPDILEKDIEYMKKAHVNTVSIGIFSWAFMEPEEGKYNFEYFDKIIKRLTENDIKIVLATPSGARPRWLADKYPEVLRVNKNMQKSLYSNRHNHCYTSLVYREKVMEIDRKLAQRYKDNKNIILWHISNEYGGECHCELCQSAFREWLKKKYDNNLHKLNHAWWSGFWSHTITDWEQIHSPVENGEMDGVLTGLFIDWRDFVTYQTTDFMKMEIDTVKSVIPDIPVTTNLMGPYQHLDYHYMKDYVDVISWDSYPKWHGDMGNDYVAYSIAFSHDLNRCLKDKPFLLMESTPSLPSWIPRCKLKKPGMHKLASLQAVAHGSDSVQYFQWRKGRGGYEKFHGAVIDHDGKAEGRVFEDVTEVGKTLEKLDDILGSTTKSKVAVVYDFRNRWAISIAKGFNNEGKGYKKTCINHYKEFWKRGINVDVIGINSDLSKYQVLVIPMLYMISEENIDRIEKFVAEGGTVIATYITGYTDSDDLCYLGGFPGGKLKDVFGLVANEIDTLYDCDKNIIAMDGKEYTAVEYCELITANTAEVIGTYKEDFYAGKPAVLRNKYKKGKAYYIGCRDTGELLDAFYSKLIEEEQLGGYDFPEGVTMHTRCDENNIFAFAQNYSDVEQSVSLSDEYTDMETGEKYNGTIILKPFAVKILRKKR